MSVDGTFRHDIQHAGECLGSDAPAPVLPADPVADEADSILLPTSDVAGYLAREKDRLNDSRRVTQNVLCPVRIEGRAIPRGKSRHSRGIVVELLRKEDGQVARFDVA